MYYFLKLVEKISEGTNEFKDLNKEIAKLRKKEDEMKSERLEAQKACTDQEKTLDQSLVHKPLWEKEVSGTRPSVGHKQALAKYCTFIVP